MLPLERGNTAARGAVEFLRRRDWSYADVPPRRPSPQQVHAYFLGMVTGESATLDEIVLIPRERERKSQFQRDRVARKSAEKPK